MAKNNIEIEIRIPQDNGSFLGIKEKLRKIAKFEKTSQQKDDYFTPSHRNFVGPEYPFEWLSIRRRAGKSLLNYKHFHPENAEITTHCDEFETLIENPDQIERVFAALDFKNLVTVEKEREVYIFKDEFEIALDTVKELGSFIEIEAIKDFGSVQEARKKLNDFAQSIGIDTSKADKRGYPFLLMKKKGLVK